MCLARRLMTNTLVNRHSANAAISGFVLKWKLYKHKENSLGKNALIVLKMFVTSRWRVPHRCVSSSV